MGKWKAKLIALVALVLLMAACGGDGASTSIKVDMADFEFSPDDWTVEAGEEITVELANNGSVEHEFVILRPGVNVTSEADLPETEEELLAGFVYWEDEVEPGESKTLTFTAPQAGTYQISCAIEGHFDAGMEGDMTAESS